MTGNAPSFFLSCFGICLPDAYTKLPGKEEDVKRIIAKATPPQAEPEPKGPTTQWRDIPLVQQYNLIKQIGKGGFSEIWLSEHKETKEVVAVKVVQLCNPDLEPVEVATLLAEAKFLRTLDCPFLLKCYDTTHNDEWLILVLEHLSGGEMLEHIHKVKQYNEAQAAKLFAQIVSSISYLHNLHLLHRDIKPENVMFTTPVEESEAEGRPLRVKVIDMGMSAQYLKDKEIRGCIGTPGFVSPEIWNDQPHTPASDVYALGVMLFIMLTGRKPHSGADIRMMTYCNKSIKDAPGLVDERFLALSAPARELVLQMLSDDPRDRPSCMAVLRHPFITADETNAEAHREMGDVVRQRMRDLVQLRRVHGLGYALRVAKPQGADHGAFLGVLEQRRMKLKEAAGSYPRASIEMQGGNLGRNSYQLQDAHLGRISQQQHGNKVPMFALTSLGKEYAAITNGNGPDGQGLNGQDASHSHHTPYGDTHSVTPSHVHLNASSHAANGGAASSASAAGGAPPAGAPTASVQACSTMGPGVLPLNGLTAHRPLVPPISIVAGSSNHMGYGGGLPGGMLTPRDSAFGRPSLPPLPATPRPPPGAILTSAGDISSTDAGDSTTPDKRSSDLGQHVPDELHARSPAPPHQAGHAHHHPSQGELQSQPRFETQSQPPSRAEPQSEPDIPGHTVGRDFHTHSEGPWAASTGARHHGHHHRTPSGGTLGTASHAHGLSAHHGFSPRLGGPGTQSRPQLATIDDMAVVNALPAAVMHRSVSMPVVDAVPGLGVGLGMGDDGERLDGGSPVASMAVLEGAALMRCMSANPFTLEMLQHAHTIDRVLAEAVAATMHEPLPVPQQDMVSLVTGAGPE